MLSRGHGLQIVRVGALHSLYESHGNARGKKRVFAVGLLAAAPARVAKDINVGRPESEPIISTIIAVALCLVVLRAGFSGDYIRHFMYDLGVPCGRQSDRLGKDGGAPSPGYAMQGLIPPVIRGNAQSRNCGRGVLHLQHFLLQSQPAHEIGRSVFRSLKRIAEDQITPGILRRRQRQSEKDGQKRPGVLQSD